MATWLDLVTDLLAFTEKLPYSATSAAQRAQAYRDVCDAFRFVYNNGDLSFKTVIKRSFTYTVQTNPAAESKGTPLPADFMGFHQTGGIYLNANLARGPLIYLPYNVIIDRTEGARSNFTDIPTHYGLGGPSDGADNSVVNQRELLLWPTPNTPTVSLKLIYQRACPEPPSNFESGGNVEIPRIPKTWHLPVILTMAKVFRKADKGADESFFSTALQTAIKQMNIQEPHGREKPARRQISPFWRR